MQNEKERPGRRPLSGQRKFFCHATPTFTTQGPVRSFTQR